MVRFLSTSSCASRHAPTKVSRRVSYSARISALSRDSSAFSLSLVASCASCSSMISTNTSKWDALRSCSRACSSLDFAADLVCSFSALNWAFKRSTSADSIAISASLASLIPVPNVDIPNVDIPISL